MTRTVAWFSAGAASAVATMLALREAVDIGDPHFVIVRIDTGSEHPDHERFADDLSVGQ